MELQINGSPISKLTEQEFRKLLSESLNSIDHLENKNRIRAILNNQFSNSLPFYLGVDLSSTIGPIESSYLRGVIRGDITPYKKIFKVKILNGQKKKSRIVYSPNSDYRVFLSWLYKSILLAFDHKIDPYAHAFRPNKSILSCALPHRSSDWLLCLDLKDFFPSIKLDLVVRVFEELGYHRDLAAELATFCTVDSDNIDEPRFLAQGFPTSGIISNLVFSSVDRQIAIWCHKNGMIYSRYADDIFISGSGYVGSRKRYTIKQCVVREVEKLGFCINASKTRFFPKGSTLKMLGLEIRDGHVTPNRRFSEYLDRVLRRISMRELSGAANHWLVCQVRTDKSRWYLRENLVDNFIAHINGIVVFIYSIDKELGKKYFRLFDESKVTLRAKAPLTSSVLNQLPGI